MHRRRRHVAHAMPKGEEDAWIPAAVAPNFVLQRTGSRCSPPPLSAGVCRAQEQGAGRGRGSALVSVPQVARRRLALVSAPLVARAQPATGKVPRIGLLGVPPLHGYARQLEAMRQGFRDLAYVEGQNIDIEYRWANGQYDQLPALAAELIRLQPDAIITSGPGIRILRRMSTEA